MEENQKVWFASDHHFGHEFLRKLRNFENTEEHDQAIIEAHNKVVKNGDDVYLLGDLLFKSKRHLSHYLEQLNGNLHLIRGNHDKIGLEGNVKGLSWVKDYHEIKVFNVLSESYKSDPQITIVLSHYPMLAWHKNSRGSIQLHGHTHLSLRDSVNYAEPLRGKTMDVCVCPENNWEPWELRDILTIMQDRPIVAPDCENY
jgi:calcineurin-like phosphoesterase family protein